jgi:hypothetical protein
MPSARRQLRKLLHAQLDQTLNASAEEDGRAVVVLDALLERAGRGYALQVRIHTEAPKPTRDLVQH